jgi:LCP family protein required for cell wall assembly
MSKRIEPDPPPRRRRSAAPPPRREARHEAPHDPAHDRLAYVLTGLLLVFGLLTSAVAYTMVRSHTYNPVVGIVNYFIPSPEQVFGKDRIYVLLMGLDYDYSSNDEPTSKDSRTDKIEAFALDFPSKVIKTVAVPRDMDAIVDGHEDKINDAYHYGGPRNSEAVVGSFLGLPQNAAGTYFDRYVVLRINASKDVIDAIGGLDVPVTETLNYDDTWGHLHIHFKPGMYHMDGDQAVSYARFRHDACSDPCRIKRQQQIERLTIEKLKNDKFNDLAHIAQLIDVVRRNVDTNFTPDEMKSLGWYFRDLNMADVHTTQIPYTTDKELDCCGDVLVVDGDARTKIVADFTGPFVAVTPPPSADQLAAVNPADVRVDVRNGSGVPGLGKRMADLLRKDGYVVTSVGNADSFDYDTTQIRATAKTPLAGERIRSDIHLDQALVTPVPDATPAAPAAGATGAAQPADVTVVIGRDYAASPSASASASI